MTMLASAWWLMVRRFRADWLVVGVTFVTVLLVTTLLAAGPIYADGVAVAGLQRTLRDAPATNANVEVAVRATVDDYPALDQDVQRQIRRVLDTTGGSVTRFAVSGPYTLNEDETGSDVAVFMFSDGLAGYASLVTGAWPERAGNEVQVAISAPVSELLGLQVGDRLALQSRLEPGSEPRPVVIAGIFEIEDVEDPFWYSDPLLIEGVVGGTSVTTYGPFLVSEAAFLNDLAPRSPAFQWRVFPDFDRLSLDAAAALDRDVGALEERLNASGDGERTFTVTTDLPAMLAAAKRSLLATRAGVLIPVIQLGFLAGYALILTTGLLLLHRSAQTTLVWARGAPRRFVVLASFAEGLALALPAALAGPWLASLGLRSLNHIGPLADIGLHLPTTVNRPAYLLSALAALVCVAILTVSAFSSTRSVGQGPAPRSREGRRPFWQRSGLDVALTVVALIGFTQLRRYGLPITSTVHGRLEVDPFLVAAPALGMLAGALVALRMLPLLSRMVERILPRWRGLVPVLALWQVARRPLRYSRAALLLMLALGIGLFAVAYTRTWEGSQQDQADYQVGADVSARPNPASETLAPLHLSAAYRELDGVTSVMALRRQPTSLPGGISAEVVLLDSDEAGATIRMRDDLSEEPLPLLAERLIERRPEIAGIPLPGRPVQLRLTVRSMIQSACPPGAVEEGEESPQDEALPVIGGLECVPVQLAGEDVYRQFDTPLSAAIVIRDASGVYFRMAGGTLASASGPQQLIFVLAESSASLSATPLYPLELIAIEFSTIAPPEPDGQPFPQSYREGTFLVEAIAVTERVAEDDWSPIALDSVSGWEVDIAQSPFRQAGVPRIRLASETASGGVDIGFVTGSVMRQLPTLPYERLPMTFRLRPSGSVVPETIPVIVSTQFLEQARLGIGDTFLLDIDGSTQQAEIVGVVGAFPTIDADLRAVILADLETASVPRLSAPGANLYAPDEYWLAVDEGHATRALEQLRQPPFSSQAAGSRFARADELRADPIALGTIGALSFGFVAAALFAWIGFASNAAVSARERLTEFALLRSLGLERRQLTGWLLLEQGLLVAMSLAGGMLLGLLLAWLTLPLITVTRTATRAFPEVMVIIPWPSVLWLGLSMVGALLLVIGALALALRRMGLGGVLRSGGM